MRTFPLSDGSGQFCAFEVPNWWLQPRAIGRLVTERLGAEITYKRRLFERSDIHLRFRYAGCEFQVVEEYGDNSRYWIGPSEQEPKPLAAINDVHAVFAAYRPGVLAVIASVFGG